MSKSVGNVLDPFELIQTYGVEYLRYYMAAEIHLGNDGDFSHDAFCARINSDLANDLGNLAQRCLTFVDKHCEGVIPQPGAFNEEDREVLDALQEALPLARGHMHTQSIKNMCDTIIQVAKMGNKYIDTQAPWALVKTDKERMRTVLYVLSELLRHTAILLRPVMPKACDEMLNQLGVAPNPQARSFAALLQPAAPGAKIGTPSPIFPKLDAVALAPKTVTAIEAEAPLFTQYEGLGVEQVGAKIVEVGGAIRSQKAAKASKEELKPLIQELTYAKDMYKTLAGVAFDPAAFAPAPATAAAS
jgi:methionyl-tRNA synthetase